MKKSILAIAVIVTLAFTSCTDDNNPSTPKSTFELKIDDLKGDITDGTVTLDPSQTYTLTGALIVKSGATLTIPAGTTIKTSTTALNTSLYIGVERGATININGEANNPVVMTSGQAAPKESDWGGLVICGDAKVNTGDNGTSEVGGLSFGGNNNADSSGKINFLRIEYTGAKFSSDKEFNGVSFFGVGSGTEVSNIYAFESGDDGIEFFGGAVNASNLVIVNAYDDSLDFADGYQGTITNVYISGVSKAGIEGSNNQGNDIATPMTDAKLINVSIVKGADAKFTAGEQAINFKEGGGKQTYTNLFVSGIDTFAKLDTGSGATARIDAGDFKVNGKNFVSTSNLTTDYVSTETGAGNGATLPTWATKISKNN
ncbi:hypothetical protein ACFSKN_06310 [Mariniflexile gromovii]|uniref:Multidrug transporter n=1 Tax=Mariniflexile gromovii TaxID=362523 RepID=A0ABS4BPW0_9FLAO|nr:hypothetical protein [Mariniflexile gromovii]MBP0902614.1 hypothetical protein [Mariniflexile gromovii]